MSWRWNLGDALLPFRFALHLERRSLSGLPSLRWEAANRSLLRTYNRLHVHREDDRYCDVLPCAPAHAPPGQRHHALAAARRRNATVCTAMLECVAPDTGGVYFYQGGTHAGESVG
jgi:hypothetical protein